MKNYIIVIKKNESFVKKLLLFKAVCFFKLFDKMFFEIIPNNIKVVKIISTLLNICPSIITFQDKNSCKSNSRYCCSTSKRGCLVNRF
jgi:multisubunit Na+/H+ antiporter MnhE subunit